MRISPFPASAMAGVIHEDAHVIAFSKPSGLSSQGGRIKAHTLDDLLWAFARSNGKRPELVHRLDRDTSGVNGRRRSLLRTGRRAGGWSSAAP